MLDAKEKNNPSLYLVMLISRRMQIYQFYITPTHASANLPNFSVRVLLGNYHGNYTGTLGADGELILQYGC